ncbi:MAG: DUF4058 family protein [Roseiflexaceae bacterium]|nr:DUF4058 family protein [Roseiflexaceae bacterium]
MLGPFPGMDPYLEEPSEWPDVHSSLISAIRDTLAAELTPAYVTRIEQRVYIIEPPEERVQTIAPDLHIFESPRPGAVLASAGAIAAPTEVEALYDLEIRDRFIEIRDARNRDIVTTIEILSPFNKTANSVGRQHFLRKREAVTSSRTHWIEIDLLRAGQRPVQLAGLSDYYVLLKRYGKLNYEVWFADLRDPLPIIGVPLRAPHPDVPLDLQTILNGIYQRAYYAQSVDYTRRVAEPPLLPADANWAAAQLQRWHAVRSTPE